MPIRRGALRLQHRLLVRRFGGAELRAKLDFGVPSNARTGEVARCAGDNMPVNERSHVAGADPVVAKFYLENHVLIKIEVHGVIPATWVPMATSTRW